LRHDSCYHRIGLKRSCHIDGQRVLALLDKGAVLVRGFDLGWKTLKHFRIYFVMISISPGTRYARRQAKGDSYSTEVFRNNYTLFGHTEGPISLIRDRRKHVFSCALHHLVSWEARLR